MRGGISAFTRLQQRQGCALSPGPGRYMKGDGSIVDVARKRASRRA